MNHLNELSYRLELFEQKVRKSGSQDCWEWIGAKSPSGAGTFGLGALGGVRSATVAAWVLYRDSEYKPDSPYIFSHACGRNDCVNPAHLVIFGPSGIENPRDVALFFSHRYPGARHELIAAAAHLPEFS